MSVPDLHLVPRNLTPAQELHPVAQEMLDLLDEIQNWTEEGGGQKGLDIGYPQMTAAFEGLQAGIMLIAGQPNTGKSSLMTNMAVRITECNPNSYVLYISLDDHAKDLLPGMIASMARVGINDVKHPSLHEQSRARVQQGWTRMRQMAGRLKVIDASRTSTNVEELVPLIERHIQYCDQEHYQLVVMLDNFHDTTSTVMTGSENSKFDYVAKELGRIADQFHIPLVCSAELRKLNGNRRPVLDDVRETVKIAYKAKVVMLLYNEVGLRGPAAQVYWNENGNEDKRPVLECRVAKNKHSSFKGQFCFEFVPEMRHLREVPPEGVARYRQLSGG